MALNPKNYIKKRFNVSQWIGASELKNNADALKTLVSNKASATEKVRKQQTKNMSFEELIQANQWSETDVNKNKKYQLKMCYGFLSFAFVILCIAIALFIMHNIWGGVFSLFFVLLGIAYAYQSWVSYEQLTQRKIRINVKKSLLEIFKRKK